MEDIYLKLQKINASSYLVLERNLEIFRLSLFTVDYTILAKKSAIFLLWIIFRRRKENNIQFLIVLKIDNYF